MTLNNFLSASAAIAPAMANHLWQSTLFMGAVAILGLAFTRNQARIRYGLWLTASLKFLIPFSWLIDLGSRLANSHLFSAQNGTCQCGEIKISSAVEQNSVVQTSDR